MNSLTKISFLIILLFKLLQAQDCTSPVTVETNLKTANIFINNEFVGTGSINKELKKGTYSLKVIEDSLTWNAETYSDIFVIEDCNDGKNFAYSFNGHLYLQSDPADSYVFINDSLIGHTPLYLASSINNLRISKPGFEDLLITPAELISNNIIKLNPFGEQDGQLFIKKDIFKILVGSAVVLGGLTAYFKLKADDYFEDYEFSGSNDLLDKTRTYDLISGFTFAALQINFGVLFYYFLTD